MGIPLLDKDGQGLRVTWGGHATVLIELDGVRLVTDPVLRTRVVHLLRHVPGPGPDFLREIDAVLISHLHFDHLDLPSLKRFGRETRMIVPAGAGPMIRRAGFRDVVELRVGDSSEIGGVTVTAVTAEHDGRRHPFGTEVDALGYVIDGSRRLFFAGDTDVHPELAELSGDLEIALLPIWGWGHRLGPGHMDPRGAAQAAALLQPELTIPIHWGTYFPIGMKSFRGGLLEKPAAAFDRQMLEIAPDLRSQVLRPGESLTRPAARP
ncbi:MAG: MBL fold metallo-hydrolase [Solirubrobacterales bacterium]|nr:MBL fold metallo-hydrolase [Solirubrobacterales bacterium]